MTRANSFFECFRRCPSLFCTTQIKKEQWPKADQSHTAVQNAHPTHAFRLNTLCWQKERTEGQELHGTCFWELRDLFICYLMMKPTRRRHLKLRARNLKMRVFYCYLVYIEIKYVMHCVKQICALFWGLVIKLFGFYGGKTRTWRSCPKDDTYCDTIMATKLINCGWKKITFI